jgi:hypothetical protein
LELFLTILTCSYPFWAVFTHFDPFSPISMARKFQKFISKCIFIGFSEIRPF